MPEPQEQSPDTKTLWENLLVDQAKNEFAQQQAAASMLAKEEEQANYARKYLRRDIDAEAKAEAEKYWKGSGKKGVKGILEGILLGLGEAGRYNQDKNYKGVEEEVRKRLLETFKVTAPTLQRDLSAWESGQTRRDIEKAKLEQRRALAENEFNMKQLEMARKYNLTEAQISKIVQQNKNYEMLVSVGDAKKASLLLEKEFMEKYGAKMGTATTDMTNYNNAQRDPDFQNWLTRKILLNKIPGASILGSTTTRSGFTTKVDPQTGTIYQSPTGSTSTTSNALSNPLFQSLFNFGTPVQSQGQPLTRPSGQIPQPAGAPRPQTQPAPIQAGGGIKVVGQFERPPKPPTASQIADINTTDELAMTANSGLDFLVRTDDATLRKFIGPMATPGGAIRSRIGIQSPEEVRYGQLFSEQVWLEALKKSGKAINQNEQRLAERIVPTVSETNVNRAREKAISRAVFANYIAAKKRLGIDKTDPRFMDTTRLERIIDMITQQYNATKKIDMDMINPTNIFPLIFKKEGESESDAIRREIDIRKKLVLSQSLGKK